jgi:hypothetical protein
MVSSSSKRTKPNINVQSMPSTGRTGLARTPTFSNRPFSQFFVVPTINEGPHNCATHGTSTTPYDSYGSITNKVVPVDSQTWLPEPQSAQLGDTQAVAYSLGQETRETVANFNLDAYGISAWSDFGSLVSPTSLMTLPSSTFNAFQPQHTTFEAQQSNWAQFSFPSDSGLATQVDCNVALSRTHSTDSNQSSQTSELDVSQLDGQAWENIPISSSSAIGFPPVSIDADFLWLPNDDEDARASMGGSQSIDSTTKISEDQELTRKKSRKPFDPTSRRKTSDTRKSKACVRCRMQKIRVCRTGMELKYILPSN